MLLVRKVEVASMRSILQWKCGKCSALVYFEDAAGGKTWRSANAKFRNWSGQKDRQNAMSRISHDVVLFAMVGVHLHYDLSGFWNASL